MTENRQTEKCSGKSSGSGTTDTEKAMDTDSGHPGKFKFNFHKCGQYTGKYGWCQKPGHKEEQCFRKKRVVPRTSNSGSNYGNSVNNTTDDVSDMFAGMTYCQVAASATVVEKST